MSRAACTAADVECLIRLDENARAPTTSSWLGHFRRKSLRGDSGSRLAASDKINVSDFWAPTQIWGAVAERHWTGRFAAAIRPVLGRS